VVKDKILQRNSIRFFVFYVKFVSTPVATTPSARKQQQEEPKQNSEKQNKRKNNPFISVLVCDNIAVEWYNTVQ
jgi:hypothetical protein